MHRLTRETLEAIVRTIPAGIVVLGEDGKIIYVNNRAIQLYGVDPCRVNLPDHSTKMMKLLTLNGEVYQPELLPASRALLRKEEAKDDLIIQRPNGSQIIVTASAKPILNEKGEVIGAVGIFEDITEKKKAEEALKVSETKYHQIIDIAEEGIWMAKPNGLTLFVNPKMANMLGYSPEYFVGKIGTEFLVKGQEQLVQQTRQELTENKRIQREYQFLHKDGTILWTICKVAPIFEKSQHVANLSMHTDITERKKAEDMLKNYADDLEGLVEERSKQLAEKERLATIGATAGMVGHDLRNPLQTIVSELYIAKNELIGLPEGQQKAMMQESLDSIKEQAEYMNKIVSDLQDFVRPVEAHKQIISLKELVVSTLAQIAVPKEIQTNLQLAENITLNTDPQLLKRVLINLITNAIQAMPKGGDLIVKAYTNDEGQIGIEVEDTGEGISEEVKPKLFTPLFTTKSKGQGFGLAVCKRVIEAQGGTITFESEIGKGTKFTVLLPK
jgi:PAS domain S-box-containing protein